MTRHHRSNNITARKEVLTIADQSVDAYGSRLDAALWHERVRRRRRRARKLCRLASERAWADRYFMYRGTQHCNVCDGPHSEGLHGLLLLLEEMFTPKPRNLSLTFTLRDCGLCFDLFKVVQQAA